MLKVKCFWRFPISKKLGSKLNVLKIKCFVRDPIGKSYVKKIKKVLKSSAL
jgi:hypothetical protein